MKQRKIPQLEIIEASDAATFTKKLNHRLAEIETLDSYDILDRNDFCAYIRYSIDETIPESIEDTYKLKYGKTYCCNDCPFLQLDPDRRSVTHHCNLDHDRHLLKQPSCDAFYEGLMNGYYSIVTPEQRQKQFDEMDAAELKRRKEVKSQYQQANKLKNKALKAEKELLKIVAERKALEDEICSEDNPLYSFDMMDFDHPLNNKALRSYEVNLIMHGNREPMTEEELIELAEELDADLCRLENERQLDSEGIVWDCIDLYWSKELRYMRENVWHDEAFYGDE